VVGIILGLVALPATGVMAGVGGVRTDGPTQIRLAWTDDPATTVTIRWHATREPATVRWRAEGTDTWTEQEGVPLDDRDQWEARIDGLEAGTTYEYEIVYAGVPTPPTTFRTAPDGVGAFRAAFVADTGIAGRLDGLTTGTDRVLDELVRLDPLVVLGGGDYAYLNSEDRYDDQDAAMDAWFEMMQPVAASRALMPTYGNHEVLLEEDVDRWAARFATPAGSPDGRSFSFDVAGVHFVALLAYEQQVDGATFDWLVEDLADARARGVREIIPYLHRNLYGNGTVHPPSGVLAAQITPVFEWFGVRVVLTAHDQSYERTFPMVGGAATTTDRIDCYVADDGITYVKTSPGGKLSNETWDFSPFEPGPADPEIAVRNNALHHISTVDVAASGSVTVTTWGLVGDDTEAVLVDRFSYGDDDCRQRPRVTPSSVVLRTDQASRARLVDGRAAGVMYSSEAAWIDVDDSGRLSVADLPPGRHVGTVVATGADGATTSIPVVAIVPPGDPDGELVVASAAGARGRRLDGATVSGDVFIEFRPRETLSEVRFLLDGAPAASDRGAPFRFPDTGDALPTTDMEPGEHRVTAVAVGGDGSSREVTATFVVDQGYVAQPATAPGEPDRTIPSARPGPASVGSRPFGWAASWPVFVGVAALGAVVALAATALTFVRRRSGRTAMVD